MIEIFHAHRHILGWIALGSLFILVASAFLVPWLVARIPADYFASEERPRSRFAAHHPVLRLAIFIIRNLIAVVLILAGIAMIFLPGQGLLTIAAGVLLLDYPGKHRLERRVVQKNAIWKSINWVRRKAGADPLIRPDGESTV